jgi:hypothetical protein
MPTGYTLVIDDRPDVSFEEFVWRCARAFGALVTMRDDSIDAPIPEELQPAPYYRESLIGAETRLQLAKAMTLDEARAAMAAEATETEVDNARRRAEHAKKVSGYRRMRQLVLEWEPPSSDHAGLRKFMLEQLSTGDPGECYQSSAFVGTAEEWLAHRIAEAERDVEWSRNVLREEEERVRLRNEWLRKLRASVPMPAKVAP